MVRYAQCILLGQPFFVPFLSAIAYNRRMRHPFRLLLLIFLMLWLPAQGFAAVSSSARADSHPMPGMEAAHPPAVHGQQVHGDSHDLEGLCGDCDCCPQCSAAALPAMLVVAQEVRSGFKGIIVAVDFSSHFPEWPQRPPLTLPA
jgi:hypothetical protein